VVRGVEILLHISGAKQAIIAIEDDKPEAYQSLLMFNHNDKISLVQIPTKYTSGAEKLLIKTLFDVEIPSGGFATDKGFVCQNVAHHHTAHTNIMLLIIRFGQSHNMGK
jgi:electron transport complex protein RnfC